MSHRLYFDSDHALSIRFTDDGRSLISRSIGGNVRIWDVTTGELEREFIDDNR